MLLNIFNIKVYNSFKSYNYDSMYIFNELENIIAIDYEKDSLRVFNTNKVLEAKYILKLKELEDLKVKYISSKNFVFIYIYNDNFESLYSIALDDNFSLNIIFSTTNVINKNPQYLNFNDYIFFYEKQSKLFSVRIKDNVESFVNYNVTLDGEIEGLNKYGYDFTINDIKYCLDGSKYDEGCTEHKYNDENYLGEYILNSDDKVSFYNKYGKEYVETVFNQFEYKNNTLIYINKYDHLFILYGEKNKDLQMIPYIVTLIPTEEYKVSLEALNTSYTQSKEVVPNTLYFSDLYICATGNSNGGLIKAGCFYPNTSEAVYEVNNKQLNYYNNYKFDDWFYKSKARFYIFTSIANLLLLALFLLIYKYLLKNNVNNSN
ncbi:MAG: hypothetical protein ACK5K7_07305 [Bacilli bacterium]